MQIPRNTALSFAGVFLFETLLCGGLFYCANLAEQQLEREVRIKSISSNARDLLRLVSDAGAAISTYEITKRPLFSDRYAKVVHEIPVKYEELRIAVGSDPGKLAQVQSLKQSIGNFLTLLTEEKANIDSDRVDVAQFRARHMYKGSAAAAMDIQERVHALVGKDQSPDSPSDETPGSAMALLKNSVIAAVSLNGLLLIVMSVLAMSRKTPPAPSP